MNKQILFATGGTHFAEGRVATLTPADKGVLAVSSILVKDHTESKMKKHNGRLSYWAVFNPKGVGPDDQRAFGRLCKRLSPEVEDCSCNINSFVLYTTNSYRFYGADMVEAMRKLYAEVAGLPDKVDDDQYLSTNGRVVSVPVANTSMRLEYTIPFDHAAWEARHKKNAEVDTTDAEAKKKQAEADQAEADAQRAAQKAKLMKTLRISLVALAIVTVVVVLALIIKKK